MIYNPKKKSERALASHDFVVTIDRVDGIAGSETDSLTLGVDSVKGLGSSVLNTIWHRDSGISDGAKTPYPGLSQAGTLTLEGIYLADLSGVKALEQWQKQCKGEVAVGLGGYRRVITVRHLARGPESEDHLALNGNLPVKKQFVVRDAFCKSLKISDLDSNSQDFAKWTIEIDFRELEVQAG